ncbi:DoxX family protein [Nocardia sienata]|uniref:DoxX family protein n=1 Tax=Nocardia sienata TaxID=248552 RepID=UPI0007A4B987|nr:DoxX family protein [Nocardia sienata]
MFIATVIVTILLSAVLLASATAKLTRHDSIRASMETVRVTADKLPWLASLEIAGALGLLGGLFWWPIGVAAAIGVILYFIGAVGAHVRVRDKELAPAAVLGLVAVAALVLRLLTI